MSRFDPIRFRAIGEAHRRYTRRINFREDWRGFLWQGRFASFPLGGDHLLNAVRYVELNPVRAGLVRHAGDYPWSSARAYLTGRPDPVLTTRTLTEMVDDWPEQLSSEPSASEVSEIRQHSSTGRPLGSREFLALLEKKLMRPLLPQKRGPKTSRPKNRCTTRI